MTFDQAKLSTGYQLNFVLDDFKPLYCITFQESIGLTKLLLFLSYGTDLMQRRTRIRVQGV